MQTMRWCKSCGGPLPADAPEELCAACRVATYSAAATQAIQRQTIQVTPSQVAPTPPGAAASLVLEPETCFGTYRIIRPLGKGGMGAAYEAEELASGRRVALKVLGQALDSPQARQRFLREGRLAASLNHPNTVYVYGTEEIEGVPVITMELVAGGTLQQRVRETGPLAVSAAADAVLQVIDGLAAAAALARIFHKSSAYSPLA